jgi:hypothetical protein
MGETLIRGAANGAIQVIRLQQDAKKQNKDRRILFLFFCVDDSSDLARAV